MSQYLIVLRKEYSQPEIIHSQAPKEELAISRANRLYNQYNLDIIMVVEVEQDKSVSVVFKRERKCKHTNAQFMLTQTGSQLTCEGCGLILTNEPISMELPLGQSLI